MAELRERTSFSSGCSLFGTPDTAKVPQPLTTPPAVNMEVLPGTPQPLVFFDVETTLLGTQLAVKVCGSEALRLGFRSL